MKGKLTQRQLAILSTVLFCANAVASHAATITVTNTNDGGPGSLRQAIVTTHDGDTITFAVTGTIVLTTGGLPVNKNVTISGPGNEQLSIDGNEGLLVFGIFPGKTAAISGLTIRNAQDGIWNEGGTLTLTNCAVSGNSQVGLFNDGMLTVSNSVISNNSGHGLYSDHATLSVTDCIITANSYSGIYNYNSHGPSSSSEHDNHRRHANKIDRPSAGDLTIANTIISDNSEHGIYNDGGFVMILNSTLTGNSAGQDNGGGGISIGSFKTPGGVMIMNSSISGNSASGSGGGIAISYGGVTLVNSTMSANSAGDGGGAIDSNGGVEVTNSTISGNSAGKIGGAIASSGRVQLTNSTISGNSAGSAGGIYYVQGQFPSTSEISNTIFDAGVLGENIVNDGATVTSHGYNISSDDGGGVLTGPGDQTNTDPLLGPLQNNGGSTLTHLPLPGSPAIDAGDPTFTPPPFHDQRGPCFHRVFGRRIDIGSVETQPRPRCVTPAPRPGS